MVPVRDIAQVRDAVHKAKAQARDFRTNFFPAQDRVEQWIARSHLYAEVGEDVALFLRRDGAFWRLYFSAATVGALESALGACAVLASEPVVTDVVGHEDALGPLLQAVDAAGFHQHAALERMALRGPLPHAGVTNDGRVVFAQSAESEALHALIWRSFDRYAEQLPTLQELEAAAARSQLLVVKGAAGPAGLLFFETQGYTSTVRYWLVAESCRGSGVGAALMRHYFTLHPAVSRFMLWTMRDNDDAIAKYRHYGYAPDGLIDYVYANDKLPA